VSTANVIFVGVGVYITIMIVVGIHASKKADSAVDFIVAGRSLPLWLCTATVIATWFGGGILIGVAGAAYDGGLLGVIADPFGATLCLVLLGLFFVRIFRRLKYFTWVELIEHRFGRTASLIASLGGLASSLFWVAGMLVAFGIVFETLTGVPKNIGIVGGSVVVVLYTMMGGMLAVALTDFLQLLIIAVGLVILLVAVLVDAGGWSPIAMQLPENAFRMLPIEHTGEQWLNYLRAWLIFGLADVASQALIGRALSARSEQVAQRAFIYGALGYLGFAMIPVMLGISASVLLPGLADSESVIPALAFEHLHPVAVAIFVGAILAAIMSSCDSSLLASSSILSTNLLPFVRPDPSDHLQLLVARWGILACGIFAVGAALNAQVVFQTVLDANLLMLSAVIVPFILGIWWRKANRTGALCAMFAGIASWLLTSILYPDLPGDLIGLAASLLTMVIAVPLTQRIDPPRPLLDKDGNPVELGGRVAASRDITAAS
jgi:SSS family solute:Na+ symporter